MHQIQFRLSAGGVYSAPPDLLAGFKGPTSKGKGKGEGRERGGRGWEGTGGRRGERRRGEGRGWEGCPVFLLSRPVNPSW